MSIAKAISSFLHRAKDDVVTTEAELEKVLAAVEPEAIKLKNAAVDEVKDNLGSVAGSLVADVKGALEIVSHDHSAAITAAEAAVAARFDALVADVHARFDALDAKLAGLKTDTAKKTAPAAKKAAAAPAAAPAADPAADAAKK